LRALDRLGVPKQSEHDVDPASLPRVIGQHPIGGPLIADVGPLGPYIEHAGDYVRIESEEELLTISLTPAVDLFAEKDLRKSQQRKELKEKLKRHGWGKLPDHGRFGGPREHATIAQCLRVYAKHWGDPAGEFERIVRLNTTVIKAQPFDGHEALTHVWNRMTRQGCGRAQSR
jgi:hypothetical protein